MTNQGTLKRSSATCVHAGDGRRCSILARNRILDQIRKAETVTIQEILQYLDIPAYSMSSCMSYSGIFHPLFSTLAITLTNCNLQLLNRHSANASQYIS